MTTSITFQNAINNEIPSLGRLANWICNDPGKAEDLVQDTMVLALRFKDNFQHGTNMRAWLTRIMKNKHISLARRKQLEYRILESEGKHALRHWSIGEMGRRSMRDDGDVYVDNGFSDTVVNAMKELRPEYRQVILLCDVDEMSYADAAKTVECPLGTIMSRLHRGRKALKKRLGSRRHIEAAA